jgi:type III restriction enzyme
LEQSNNLRTAFSDFWESKGISLKYIEYEFLKPYNNSIKGVPHAIVKVPSAGSKTFIACNAKKPISESFPFDKP